MNKARLEAFSDGVFAIVITLLILDIRLPSVGYSALPAALKASYPKILSYVLSFAIIGLYWIGHHIYARYIAKLNGLFLWLNILLLLLISFIPFPTSLMGAYPYRPLPLLIYGLNLLAVNLVSLGMIFYIYTHRHLADASLTRAVFHKAMRMYLILNIPYIIALFLTFSFPIVSYILYITALLLGMLSYALQE